MADNYYIEERPWGWFKILLETPQYKVKEILVKPNSRLSYQSHKRRSEHWLIVQGTATVVLNDVAWVKKAGDSIEVPVGAKHRIGNHTAEDVIFIEIQRGEYFGEDDIERYSDDYNRT
ncbi:MAG: phosphomannose isomerase type II C-terminal cupin domain [Candidatus Magasanikbacteria bacterium]|nr:phosphomannose isomerase type II C-terminal cupin domain [Candidatus Magasanikbacteria bacterium]